MLNIAVVGTGLIGIDHLKAISLSDNCRLCALCDVKEDVAKALGEEYCVPWFTDYREIIGNADVDAVILNLPHYLHCESTVYFLENGVHVLIEKPMANTVEECDLMIAAAEKSGKKLAVGHVQRFYEANRIVKNIIKSGKLGKLCMFTENRTVEYFSPSRPKWFLDKKLAGGGIVMNYGAHALDKLFYALDTEDVELVSSVGNIKNDAAIEGHAQIFLKFRDNISATVTFCGYTNSGYDSIYYFTDGVLKVTGGSSLSTNTTGEWITEDIPTDAVTPLKCQLEEFCKYVNNEPCDIADGKFGRAVIFAIEKIYSM